jgi:hypothetical protein
MSRIGKSIDRKQINGCQGLGGGSNKKWLHFNGMGFLFGVVKIFWN